MNEIELGLGLLSVGRVWGLRQVLPPTEPAAIRLIGAARARGIRFFDTAPAYAASERILGKAIKSHPEISEGMFIATKAGEHWQANDQSTLVDHSYDALCRSIGASLDILGRIDLLQIHKASVEAVCSSDVSRAIAFAKKLGIAQFGASVSSMDAAKAAIRTGIFAWLQFPFNSQTDGWDEIGSLLREAGMKAIVNRPFAMGAAANSGPAGRIAAFTHILGAGLPPGSVVLTGTSSIPHLLENLESFHQCRK